MIVPFKEYPINEASDFITRVDKAQASPMYALRMRGTLNRKRGIVCEMDYGTQHRFGVYPIRPNTHKVVSGAADNGAGLIRITTSTAHGYSTDDLIYHAEIGGTTEANNIYPITVIDSTHYDLVGSTFTNAYTSGGICTDTPIDLFDCFVLRDPDTGTEYEIVVGIDQNTKTRLYLWNGSAWIELTQKINALINGAPTQPATPDLNQTVIIDTPTDEGGAVYTLANDALNGYVVYHAGSGTASIVLDSTATTIVIPHDVTIVPFEWANNDALVFFRCTGIYNSFNYANGASPHVRHLSVEAQKKMTIYYADNSGSSLVRKNPMQIAKQDNARGLFPAVTGGVQASGTANNSAAVLSDQVTVNGILFLSSAPTFRIIGAANNGAGLIRIEVDSPLADLAGAPVAVQGGTGNYAYLTEIFQTGDSVTLAGIVGTTEANGVWPITVIDATHFDLVGSTFANPYVSGGSLVQTTPVRTLILGTGGSSPWYLDLATAVNSHGYLSTIMTAVQAGAVTTMTAILDGVIGNTYTLAELGNWVISGANFTGGVDPTSAGRLNLSAGWYTEEAYVFGTAFGRIGTIEDPKLGTDGIESVTVGDGVQIQASFDQVANTSNYTFVRCYITAMYRGYEESDPIFQLVLNGSTTAFFPKPTITLKVNPAVINKDITSFRLYIACKTDAVASQKEWAENAQEYVFAQERVVRSESGLLSVNNWTLDNQTEYCYSVAFSEVVEADYDTQLASAADNLLARLNHEPQVERTALQPLFGVKITRQQGSVQIVDESGDTLRRSSYDGDGVHEDDNYPAVDKDEDVNLLHIPLSGSGEVLGLEEKNGVIHIHRDNELETFNLFNNDNEFLRERTTSGLSIHNSGKGIAFASSSGLKLLPVGGSSPKTLNPLWDNYYDGSLLIDDRSASYITQAFREAIVGGYFSVLEEHWFAFESTIDTEDGGGTEILVARFSWKNGKWMIRKFHLGDTIAPNLTIADDQSRIKALRERSDGTMMIVTKRGIFSYPYTGTLYYQDGVYSDDRSSDRGIPIDITLNIGGLSNAIPNANIIGAKVKHEGESVDGGGFVTIRYYRNYDLSTFETKRFRVDDPATFREFERAGSAEAMQIRISTPDGDLDNFKQLDISQIVVGYRNNQVPPQSGS